VAWSIRGSHTLANACAQTRYGGVVTGVGLAQGMDLPMTVGPLILRAGATDRRRSCSVRARAATSVGSSGARSGSRQVEAITRVVPLSEAFAIARAILAGRTAAGRGPT